jgi:hypothetical protein
LSRWRAASSRGAFIAANNAEDNPDSLARGCMATPFAEDVELSMRIG